MSSNQPGHAPPRRFGDYIIHRVLGQGGMGTVYEAEEQLSHRRVALKILRSELSGSVQGRRQFVAEMGILASLDDPHIVRCLHCTEIEGQLVMALEYLEGQTLREVLNTRGALPHHEVAAYAWQIVAALRVAHSRQPAVIHRDLKPENVMCLPDGRVKVMDFGIAKIVQTMAGTTTNNPGGTLQYMSPEQIDARPADGRSDLFALGLIMWELLAGRPPFVADSPRVLMEKLCTEPAPRLPDDARVGLPPNLEYLIARLLQKHPDERPRDADEVLAILAAARPAPMAPLPTAGFATPSSAASTAAHEIRPARFDTVAIIDHASRPHGPRPWIAPVAAVSALTLAAVVIGWFVVRPLIGAPGPDRVEDVSAASSVGEQAGDSVSEQTRAAVPACQALAPRWQGAWELRTLATKAIKSSWIGGQSLTELTIDVDGCQLAGSGRKLLKGAVRWEYKLDGIVTDDGSAQLHYRAVGRNIEGIWSITPQGNGTWTSAADDVSGTLTATRVGAER